ncbi:MAG: protein kinase [archaeon]|nr:protein kinase [archaeon]
MGVCDSSNSHKEKRKQNQNIRNYNPKEEKVKYKENGSNATKSTSNTKGGEYILSVDLAKHDDVTKYYKLSPEELGSGASGTVCEAEDSKGNKYAIKRINKSSIKSKQSIIKEAEFNRKFQHPNIIKCYEIYEDNDTISFVLELAEGGDLFDLIVNSPKSKLPLYITIILLEQILDTVSFLHNEQKVIHRDIKPENLMVQINKDNMPMIKVIDFGLSEYKPIKGDINTYLTDFVGTPAYAAPELANRYPYDEMVDMWAIGVLLFNMMTGYEPFSSNCEDTLKEQILFREVPFDKIEYEDMRNLCKKLLERDSDKRLKAKEALEELRKIKKNLEMDYEIYKKEETLGVTEAKKKDASNNGDKNKAEFDYFKLFMGSLNGGFSIY